jgi:hypothetical protein
MDSKDKQGVVYSYLSFLVPSVKFELKNRDILGKKCLAPSMWILHSIARTVFSLTKW